MDDVSASPRLAAHQSGRAIGVLSQAVNPLETVSVILTGADTGLKPAVNEKLSQRRPTAFEIRANLRAE